MSTESQYLEATAIATTAHEGRTRKMGDDKGKPYIIHPLRVAESVDRFRYVLEDVDEIWKIKTVAILHDVAEDEAEKGYTTEYLVQTLELSPEQQFALIAVTRKENESYYEFIMRIIREGGEYGIIVKILDIEDNMKSLKSGSLRDKYQLAHHILVKALGDIHKIRFA